MNEIALKKQVRELIEAQDIVRRVYIQHSGAEEIALRDLDKQMSATINLVGKGLVYQ